MTSAPDTAPPLWNTPSALHWRLTLDGCLQPERQSEITAFETELKLKKAGKIEDKLFAETRLRCGVYGQRYDNGKRHDGTREREIPYPERDILKGPNTLWHAPGMQRIKIPYGGLTGEQMDVLADVAEEYSDGILHVTTRQDFQLHFIHIEDTPAIFRRLGACGITVREACGNTVRNVTACPYAGTCADEIFDVTPYADAMFKFLLGHPDTQDFGRKFKIAFSGCKDKPCALANIHDIGFIAATRLENGAVKRGFKMLVGGGLGAVPYQAQEFTDFVPDEEILPLTQAVCRIFTVHGEKKNRNKARLKFLLADWGLEKFREAVRAERVALADDPRWTSHLTDTASFAESPPPPLPVAKTALKPHPDFAAWSQTNVALQRQAGFTSVLLHLPLGDLSSEQMRSLADICRRYCPDRVRTTQDQNLLLRWIADKDLVQLHADLRKIGLALPGASTIADITACPGTDTCKLGISSSRGLAAVIGEKLQRHLPTMDDAVKKLSIKISGCFNSCAQHHVADIGFYGVGRKVGNYLVPYFQLVLGGTTRNNGESYGLAVMAVPAKAVPQALKRLTDTFVAERDGGEDFRAYTARKGKSALKTLLAEFAEVPPHDTAPEYYVDFSDVREYSKSDIGMGECAGEVVSAADFGLKAADRLIFAAQLKFDGGDFASATLSATAAMFSAAEGLVKLKEPFTTGDDAVRKAFARHYCDTKLFYDPFAGDRFVKYFLKPETAPARDGASAKRRLDEAQLFIDAAHACLARSG